MEICWIVSNIQIKPGKSSGKLEKPAEKLFQKTSEKLKGKIKHGRFSMEKENFLK